MKLSISIITIYSFLCIGGWMAKKAVPRFCKDCPVSGIIPAFIIKRLMKKYFPLAVVKIKEKSERLNAGEDYDEVLIGSISRVANVVLLSALIPALLWIVLCLSGANGSRTVNSLERPANGSKVYNLTAEYEERSYNLDITVGGRKLYDSEAKRAVSELADRLPEMMLGLNPDSDHVFRNLELKNEYADVSVYWSSSNPGLLSSSGKIMYVPAEVTPVVLTAYITCGDVSEEHEYTVYVAAENKEQMTGALISETVKSADEDSINDEFIELPDEIDGERITFRTLPVINGTQMFFIGVTAVLLTVIYMTYCSRQKMVLRNRQLAEDYPVIVRKLCLLLEAGISVTGAFERIVSDREKRNEKKRYAYGELRRMCTEIGLGISEEKALTAFGDRCGLLCYIRFVSLLCQNIRRGNESIISSLEKELEESSRIQRSMARKKGEAVGVKLLLPMAGMFALIMAFIIVPAFITM